MGKLTFYDTDIPHESIVKERDRVYLNRTARQRFFSLLELNRIAVMMNGGRPLKSLREKASSSVVRMLSSDELSFYCFNQENLHTIK
ncbi:hypothetical protein [Pedobacter endophyticus]|uniref:Uncharacterized protein n=1 Tax=Pedobacter endophyticus TaxID=2789740 RepID=A0A7S9PZ89_9SPHI|nr:hypothetical protein [Pedobacter endophyticus]QPH40263.1 hypothetical protein IZT61_03005 [Pedobacter endophyticus]